MIGCECGAAQPPVPACGSPRTRTSEPGQLGLVVDSYGLLSIATDRQSAAEELLLGAGDEVVLEPIPDDELDGSVMMSTTVSLGQKRPR